MSENEQMAKLREQWNILYRFMEHERRMREKTFSRDKRTRDRKLAEWERAMKAADYIRDAAKVELIVQQRLIWQPEQWSVGA